MSSLLLVVADAGVDAGACKHEPGLADGRVVVVVGEEHLGLDGLGGTYQLVDGHGVGLVAGQEGDVDVFQLCHLGDVLGVAGDVDAQSVEGEYVAVVAAAGMVLLAALGGVIGWYGLEGEGVAKDNFVAVLHDAGVAVELADVRVGEDDGISADELCECHAVEVVGVLVGDEDVVGPWHRGVVGLRLERGDGVEVEVHAVVLDHDAGMLDTGELDFLARGGLEGVGLALLGVAVDDAEEAAEQGG